MVGYYLKEDADEDLDESYCTRPKKNNRFKPLRINLSNKTKTIDMTTNQVE